MVAAFTYASVALSFLTTMLVIPLWSRTAKRMGFTGRDINKEGGGVVAEAGGLCVILGAITGFFVYVGTQVFYYGIGADRILFAFAAATTVLLSAFIGFMDDILGWKRGISRSYKVILTFLMPLPIMILNAGSSFFTLPFIGRVDFGILFPLVIVPAAIVGTSNGFNMLAGYNGLEAGLGAMILSSLGLMSFWQGELFVAALCAVVVAALLAFLHYNWYPAKIFPGDTLTYSVGALIGVVAVLGNIEKFALILFVPYFIEFLLKLRGGFEMQSYAEPKGDGTISNLYDKFYSIPHIATSLVEKFRGAVYEREVVGLVYVFELFFVAVAFLSYFWIIPI